MNPDQARQLEQFCAEMLDHLPVAHAPDEIWAGIERSLAQPAERPRRWFPFLAAFAAATALMAVLLWVRQPGDGWIETGPSSTRTVAIGTIGTVEIAPNTKLRVVADRPGEHRLTLAHGEIHAKILAPPRLFFVDTAAGTAVDLGCEYSLHADADGASLLQVTRGWVSFQWKGVESLVPAGASCRAYPEGGPGVPYFDDAPESLKEALDAKTGALDAILSAARVRDTLTLWHLMWRVAPEDRERVYDRMAALTPVPAGVSREMVLRLDPGTMARWKDELAWTW
jgi:ferric-dicitrate binding protein FerR (iron transport regulator)